MSATCHVAKEQLEVLPGRSPLGVVPSSAVEDAESKDRSARCQAPQSKPPLSSQPGMSATCRVAEEQQCCCPGRKPLGMLALLATGSGPLTGSLWVASAITFPSPEGVGTCRFGNTPRTREALLTRPSPVTAADRSTATEALPSHCRRAPPTACRWTDKASCCTFSVVIFRQQRESFSLHQENFSS